MLGESLPIIGKQLGHARVQKAARYAHLVEESVKESATPIAARHGYDTLSVRRGGNG